MKYVSFALKKDKIERERCPLPLREGEVAILLPFREGEVAILLSFREAEVAIPFTFLAISFKEKI